MGPCSCSKCEKDYLTNTGFYNFSIPIVLENNPTWNSTILVAEGSGLVTISANYTDPFQYNSQIMVGSFTDNQKIWGLPTCQVDNFTLTNPTMQPLLQVSGQKIEFIANASVSANQKMSFFYTCRLQNHSISVSREIVIEVVPNTKTYFNTLYCCTQNKTQSALIGRDAPEDCRYCDTPFASSVGEFCKQGSCPNSSFTRTINCAYGWYATPQSTRKIRRGSGISTILTDYRAVFANGFQFVSYSEVCSSSSNVVADSVTPNLTTINTWFYQNPSGQLTGDFPFSVALGTYDLTYKLNLSSYNYQITNNFTFQVVDTCYGETISGVATDINYTVGTFNYQLKLSDHLTLSPNQVGALGPICKFTSCTLNQYVSNSCTGSQPSFMQSLGVLNQTHFGLDIVLGSTIDEINQYCLVCQTNELTPTTQTSLPFYFHKICGTAIQASKTVANLSVTLGSNGWVTQYTVPNFYSTTQPTECTPDTFEIFYGLSGQIYTGGLLRIDNSTSPASFQVDVQTAKDEIVYIKISRGAEYYFTNLFQITFVCNSVGYTVQENQTVTQVQSQTSVVSSTMVVQFQLNQLSVSQDYCYPTQISAYDSLNQLMTIFENNTLVGVLNSLQTNVFFTVRQSEWETKTWPFSTPWQFYIWYKLKGGQEGWVSGNIYRLNLYCDALSVNLSQVFNFSDTIQWQNTGMSQYYVVNFSRHFTVSMCPIDSSLIMLSNSSNTLSQDVVWFQTSNFNLSNELYAFRPANDMKDYIFRFYVNFTSVGGAVWQSPLLMFNFGCNIGGLRSVTSNSSNQNFYQYWISNETLQYTIYPPKVDPSYCVLVSNEVRFVSNTLNNLDTIKMAFNYSDPSCTTLLCFKVKVTEIYKVYDLVFYIRYTFKGGETFDDYPVLVESRCNNFSDRFKVDNIMNVTAFQYDRAVVTFPPVGCFPTDCCKDLIYISEAKSSGKLPTKSPLHLISQPLLLTRVAAESYQIEFDKLIYADVFTGEIAEITYTIFVTTQFGQVFKYNSSKVNVIYNCYCDNIILSSLNLSSTDFALGIPSFKEGSTFKTHEDVNEAYFKLEWYTTDKRKLSFSIINRVYHNATKECPLYYNLSRVFDLNSKRNLTAAMMNDLFSLTLNGTLTVRKTNAAMLVDVFISVNNTRKIMKFQRPFMQLNINYPEFLQKNAPKFDGELVDYKLPFDKNYSQQLFQVQLPSIKGLTSDFKLLIEPPKPFLSYNPELNSFIISGKMLNFKDIGVNQFQIILANKETSRMYLWSLNITNHVTKEIKNDLNLNNSNAMVHTFSAFIKSIDEFGFMQINFSQALNPTLTNINFINQSSVDIYLNPYDNWSCEDQEFNMSNLNFTWKVMGIDRNLMNISLKFNDPFSVSPMIKQDEIVWHLKNKQACLLRAVDNSCLASNSFTLRAPIKKQLILSSLTTTIRDTTVWIQSTLEKGLYGSFVLNIAFSGFLSQLLGMISSLQLILHLPIFSIIVPANVAMTFGILIPIVMYDVLSSFLTPLYEKFYPQDYDVYKNQTTLDQMVDLGYDSFNPLINLGTLSALVVLYFLKIICVFLFGRLLIKIKPAWSPKYKKIKNQLFWSDFLVIFIEGYLEFLISSFLIYEAPATSSDKDAFTMTIGITGFVIANAILPGVVIYHVSKKPLSYFKTEQFEENWGSLYHNIAKDRKSKILFVLVYLARRAIYVWSAVVLKKHPGIQIIVLLLLNLFIQIYQINISPRISKIKNLQETLSDIAIVQCSFVFAVFSDWGPSQKMKYNIGWVILCIMAISILINFFFITSHLQWLAKVYCIKFCKILFRYIQKKWQKPKKAMDYLQYRWRQIQVLHDRGHKFHPDLGPDKPSYEDIEATSVVAVKNLDVGKLPGSAVVEEEAARKDLQLESMESEAQQPEKNIQSKRVSQTSIQVIKSPITEVAKSPQIQKTAQPWKNRPQTQYYGDFFQGRVAYTTPVPNKTPRFQNLDEMVNQYRGAYRPDDPYNEYSRNQDLDEEENKNNNNINKYGIVKERSENDKKDKNDKKERKKDKKHQKKKSSHLK